MKNFISMFTVLIFVGLPTPNAHAEEVVNKYLSEKASITGIYYDPTPLPDFPGGLFRFIATVRNITSDKQVASLAFRVRQLTNGNTLFNGDNGRYGRLTSQITAGGVFEWKPGDMLSAQHVVEVPDMVEAPALIQSNLPPGSNGNFEVVYRDSNDELRHLFRRNDVDGFPWVEGNADKAFGDDVNSEPALIQSNLPQGGVGDFEVVYRDHKDQLRHWSRKNDVEGFPWVEPNGGKAFGYDVNSAPALIQSNLPQGGVGNFEVVYRDSNDQLRHWFRRNDVEGFPWVEGNGGKAFAYDVKSAPALIQDRRNGNLEVVYRDSNNQLRHWYRDSNAVWRPGNDGVPVPDADDVTSAPALIQSNLGSQGDNFEVVVRKSDNKLYHYFRQRNPEDQNVFEWKSGGEPFADNVNSAPALIQCNLGAAGGNFEVVAQEEGDLRHYFRTKKGEVILKPGQEVSTQFVIGLVDRDPEKFRLFVDAVGIQVPESTMIVYLGDKDATFDENNPDNNGFNVRVKEVAEANNGNLTFIIKKGLYRKQSIILDPEDSQETAEREISFIGEDGSVMSGAELLTDWTRIAPTSANCWFTEYSPEQQSLIHPNDANNNSPFCLEATCKYREDLYLNDRLMEQVDSAPDTVLTMEGQWRFDETRDNNNVPNFIAACFERDGEDRFNIAEQKIEISRSRVAFGGVDRFVQGERQCLSDNPDNNIKDDPNNDGLETCRSTSNIAIKNLIIEKYATPIQFGAVGYQKPGDNWVVENNEVRWNHAAGIAFGNNAKVSGNYVHENGQIGIKTGIVVDQTRFDNDPPLKSFEDGKPVAVTQNVIEQNGKPQLGYDPKNEAGGTKFSETKGLLIDRNWVKDNGGPGLWGDINNCDMDYYCNVVEHNRDEGIVHELSYRTDIAGNIVRGNGFYITRMVNAQSQEPEEPVWNSQIYIRTSSDAEVHENHVEADDQVGNGITIIEEIRGEKQVDDNTGEVKIHAFDYCDENEDYERDRYYGRNNKISQNDIIHPAIITTDNLKDDKYETAEEKKAARSVLDPYTNGINGASLYKIDNTFDDNVWTTNSYSGNRYYLDNTVGEYWNWTIAGDTNLDGLRMDLKTFRSQALPEGTQEKCEKGDTQCEALPFEFKEAPLVPVDCQYGDSVTEEESLKEESVCLVAFNNENYLVNEQFGYPVSAKGIGCDQDARLVFEDKNGGQLVDGDIVFIRTANNAYWSASSEGVLSVSSIPAATDDRDFRFQVHKVNEGSAIISDYDQLALKTFHDKWVVAEDGGGDVVRANRPTPDEWETFTYIPGN